MNETLTLYGSGDKGTVEMRRRLNAAGRAYKFLDIRDAAHGRANLVFLCENGIKRVPALFRDGKYLGEFDQAVWLIGLTENVAILPPEPLVG